MLSLGAWESKKIDDADISKMILATIPAVALAYFGMKNGIWSDGPSFFNVSVFMGSAILGAIIYNYSASTLGIAEMKSVLARIRSRLI